jgi:hypothetical protein
LNGIRLGIIIGFSASNFQEIIQIWCSQEDGIKMYLFTYAKIYGWDLRTGEVCKRLNGPKIAG